MLLLALILPCFACIVISCSTSVPVSVTRPAELDLKDVDAITVLPFLTSDAMAWSGYSTVPVNTFNYYWGTSRRSPRENDEAAIANTLTFLLKRQLLSSSRLYVTDPVIVEQAYRNNAYIPADIYVTGGIIEYDSFVEDRESVTTKKDGTKEKTIYYKRIVNLNVVYQVVDVKTGAILSYREQEFEIKSSEEKHRRDLATPLEMTEPKLYSIVTNIMKEFEPYTESFSLTLLSHKDESMKDAEKLAKKGQIVLSKNQYLALYKTFGYFEAGYNAALLLQAFGDLQEAKKLMTQVYNATGDSRAHTALDNINYEIQSASRLKKQIQERQ